MKTEEIKALLEKRAKELYGYENHERESPEQQIFLDAVELMMPLVDELIHYGKCHEADLQELMGNNEPVKTRASEALQTLVSKLKGE